jgi:hypothetical protein
MDLLKIRPPRRPALAFSILGMLAACSAPARPSDPACRPVREEGLRNTHEMSPGVFRGGQPSLEGLQALERRGVRTVINLRAEAPEADSGSGLKVVHVPLKSWKADHETIVAFLRAAVEARKEGGCFFH